LLNTGGLTSSQYIGTNMKYAYVTFKDLLPCKTLFGQQPRPWVGHEEALLGTRYILSTALDAYKYEGSTDMGISFADACGSCDWQFMLSNGEGDKKPESGPQKDVAFRVTWAASKYDGNHAKIDGLHVSFGGVYGFVGDRHGEKSRVQLLIGVRSKEGISWGIGLHQMADAAANVASVSTLGAALGATTTAHGGAATLYTRITICPKTDVFAELAYVDPTTSGDEILSGQSNPGTVLRGMIAFEYQPILGTTIAFVYAAEQRKGGNGSTGGVKMEIALK
jgi:hypothetical protein